MTKEEGSENPSRSPSNLQDEVQKKPLIKYKRNPRLSCSNVIEDEVKSSENSNDDRDDHRTISSTSSFVKAAQEKKMPEIIPFKKRSSYMICHDDNLSPQSQPATRESGDKLSPSMSAGEENFVEKKTGDQNLVEGSSNSISTKIHDGGHSETTGITPQGGHGYNHIAPTDDEDGKQADETKQDTGGGGGSGCSPTDTVVEKSDGSNETDCGERVQEMAMKDGVAGDDIGESIGGRKPAGYFVSLMMDDDGEVPDQLIELDDDNGAAGSSRLLAGHAAVESYKDGGSGEAGDGEGQQQDGGGCGNNSSNTPGGEEKSGGKKPIEADGEQVHPTDLVIQGGGGGGGKGKEVAITPTLEGDHTPSGIADTSGSILAQGQQDPNTIICGNQSTHEEGVVAEGGEDADDELGQQASKKVRYGSDEIVGSSSNALGPNGGIGDDEPQVPPPVLQHATRTIRLFGVDISCEQEHHVPITISDGGGGNNQEPGGGAAAGDGPRPMMRPRPAIRLFGVDIFSDQVQLAAMGDGDGRSRTI